MFSFLHETKDGLLPLIFFTISFGDCWFILRGNHAIPSLAMSLIELWMFWSCSLRRSLCPWPLTAHSRLASGPLLSLLPVCGLFSPGGLVPSLRCTERLPVPVASFWRGILALCARVRGSFASSRVPDLSGFRFVSDDSFPPHQFAVREPTCPYAAPGNRFAFSKDMLSFRVGALMSNIDCTLDFV